MFFKGRPGIYKNSQFSFSNTSTAMSNIGGIYRVSSVNATGNLITSKSSTAYKETANGFVQGVWRDGVFKEANPGGVFVANGNTYVYGTIRNGIVKIPKNPITYRTENNIARLGTTRNNVFSYASDSVEAWLFE